MAAEDRLAEYRRRRDLSKTDEPAGRRLRRTTSTEEGAFVIQKHAASRLHYDFRLESDGVLKSWSVPKGPSTDPREKRLAVPTEDHPIEYADFEGTIAPGEYGAGSVIVWDAGTYRNLTESDGDPVTMAEGLETGHVAVWLEGQKLSGGWALTRTGRADDSRWLLVKIRDEGADARRNPVSSAPESVRTGRTVEEVSREDRADGTDDDRG